MKKLKQLVLLTLMSAVIIVSGVVFFESEIKTWLSEFGKPVATTPLPPPETEGR